MIVSSDTKFHINKNRYKQEYMSKTFSSSLTPYSSINDKNKYQDIKRPLNTNPQDLSFKGLSFMYKTLDKKYSIKEFSEFCDKHLGNMGKDLLHDITKDRAHMTSELISVNGDEIILKKKTIPHLALDGVLYPFKILPFDIVEGTVSLLGKIPGLKNWSKRVLEKDVFKNIRQRSKIDAKVNALRGLITFRDFKIQQTAEKEAKRLGKNVEALTKDEMAEVIAKVDKNMDSDIFKTELKMFDPNSGNYDTKHERALNRLVSGLPPAIFLANDAYNLSRMMDDDNKAAEQERKIRFRQEVSRILTSGYLTLITMGAFQKFINKSKFGIVLTTGITVLVTEMFSRLSNGKHITRLTPEEARKENMKHNNPEANIAQQTNGNVSSTGNNRPNQKEQQKPLLSFDTLLKASGVVLALGYGIKGFKHLPSIKKAALNYFENMKTNNSELYKKLKIDDAFKAFNEALENVNPKKYNKLTPSERKQEYAVDLFMEKVLYRPFTNFYKSITSEKFLVDTKQFDEVIKVMKENGFEKLAQKYESVGKGAKIVEQNGEKFYNIGTKDKEFNIFGKKLSIKPLVNFLIAPFKFMWNTVTLPYWMIDEKLLGVIKKTPKIKKSSSELDALANSFNKIYKQATKKNFNAKQFKDYLQDNLLKAFNEDSLSSVSNAELSNLAKTAAAISTIWFLMTDNYNMVMLKSNGNDKDGANTKFKERFVQEGSRLFYQTLLIDLFNSTFRNQYNSSLLGMSAITLVDTTLGEMLTRSSVGVPLKAHTRDELIKLEEEQNNSKGFKKKYYNFMQRLTGKRAIKTYEVSKKNYIPEQNQQTSNIPTLTANKQVIFKQNNEMLEKMRGNCCYSKNY